MGKNIGGERWGEFHFTRAARSRYKKHKGALTETLNVDRADVSDASRSVFSHRTIFADGTKKTKKQTKVHNLFKRRQKLKFRHFFFVFSSPLMASSVLRKVYLEKEVSCWGDVNVIFGHKTPFCVHSFAVSFFSNFFSGFVLNEWMA